MRVQRIGSGAEMLGSQGSLYGWVGGSGYA